MEDTDQGPLQGPDFSNEFSSTDVEFMEVGRQLADTVGNGAESLRRLQEHAQTNNEQP